MKKTFSFKINNHIWKVKQKPRNIMLDIYKNINEEAIDCFGLTLRQFNLIYINDGLCEEQKIKTLKHELTHCFIWEMGFYYIDFEEETICEFVSAINDFINYVIEKGSEE